MYGDRLTCDVIEGIDYLPAGWPYGPVGGVSKQQRVAATVGPVDPRLS